MDNQGLPMDAWGKDSLSFLRQLFARASQMVRISTGFYSASGFDLVRKALEGLHLRVMVGYDERANHQLTQTLMNEFREDLSRWHGNRRPAIEEMVRKLQQGQLSVMEARTRRGDHGKVYLIDQSLVMVGSTNFTRNGLLVNIEANAVEDAPERVQFWSQRFDEFWNLPDSHDISKELLAYLLGWLELRTPFTVYLKSVEQLIGQIEPRKPRKGYRMPADFQMVLVRRALMQMERYRGAMIVASTGLGKTVVGTHIAHELAYQHKISNALIFAPRVTRDEWITRMKTAAVAAQVVTLNLLDRRNSR